jgi:uncharacterized HAD superfamily protein
MKDVIVIGNKPYKKLSLNSLLDSFDGNHRCNMSLTNIEHQDFYNENMKVLPGTLEKLKEWDRVGYKLILTTGRRESSRDITVEHLEKAGIHYDHLIMGLGPDERVIINDRKPFSKEATASSINLVRNQGIKDVLL